MSSSKPSAVSFWFFAGFVLAASALALVAVLPAANDRRHQLEHWLISRGDLQTGLRAAAWYDAARSIAPRDQAPAIKLARLDWEQGSKGEAASVLARYGAPEATVLRGQYLVRLERYNEAEAILRPLKGFVGTAGGDIDASYWLGVALAEQGKLKEALAVFGSHPANMLFEPSIPYVLLQQELGTGPANLQYANPEVIAGEYAKQGMIRSAQRVLAENHVTSASSWVLRAQLDQALVKINWQEVEGDYEQALVADPSNSEVIIKLRQVATRNKDVAELQKLDQLQQLLPSK